MKFEVYHVIGIISGTTVVVYLLGSALLKKYFEARDKLEILRQKYTDKSILRVENDSKEIKARCHHLADKVEKNTVEVSRNNTKLEQNIENYNKLLTATVESNKKVHERLTYLESLEVIKIGPDRFILKGRKRG